MWALGTGKFLIGKGYWYIKKIFIYLEDVFSNVLIKFPRIKHPHQEAAQYQSDDRWAVSLEWLQLRGLPLSKAPWWLLMRELFFHPLTQFWPSNSGYWSGIPPLTSQDHSPLRPPRILYTSHHETNNYIQCIFIVISVRNILPSDQKCLQPACRDGKILTTKVFVLRWTCV